jgi:hypothetical protein
MRERGIRRGDLYPREASADRAVERRATGSGSDLVAGGPKRKLYRLKETMQSLCAVTSSGAQFGTLISSSVPNSQGGAFSHHLRKRPLSDRAIGGLTVRTRHEHRWRLRGDFLSRILRVGPDWFRLFLAAIFPDGREILQGLVEMVGARGFEPPTPCPPDKCANRAALRSDGSAYRVGLRRMQCAFRTLQLFL